MIKIQTLPLLKKLNKKVGLPGFELELLLPKAVELDELQEFIDLRRLEEKVTIGFILSKPYLLF